MLAIFPRGKDNNDGLRKVNTAANNLIAKVADGKMVYFLNINDKFLDRDGKLPTDIMPDLLHPNEKGYEIWSDGDRADGGQADGREIGAACPLSLRERVRVRANRAPVVVPRFPRCSVIASLARRAIRRSAQGCRAAATLGDVEALACQPEGVAPCGDSTSRLRNPVGVFGTPGAPRPRVAGCAGDPGLYYRSPLG